MNPSAACFLNEKLPENGRTRTAVADQETLDMAVIKASKREQFGTHKSRALRKQGKIPAIIYGHGETPEAVTISEHDIELAMLHGERMLEIDVAGTTQNVLIKDVQYDTYGLEVIHVDLTRVSLDERVEVTVPVVLKGTAAGLADGGSMQQVTADVTLECVVTAIPEEITLQVNAMKIGDTVHVRDLELPEGAVLVTDEDLVVCSVTVIAEEEEPTAEEGESAEPEVIGEKKDEDEEQAEEE